MYGYFSKDSNGTQKSYLQRRLGLAELIFLGVGSIVGTGIFTITGMGAAQYAGPAITVSILIAAFCVTISALFLLNFLQGYLIQEVFIAICILFLESTLPGFFGWFMIIEFAGAISTAASGQRISKSFLENIWNKHQLL